MGQPTQFDQTASAAATAPSIGFVRHLLSGTMPLITRDPAAIKFRNLLADPNITTERKVLIAAFLKQKEEEAEREPEACVAEFRSSLAAHYPLAAVSPDIPMYKWSAFGAKQGVHCAWINQPDCEYEYSHTPKLAIKQGEPITVSLAFFVESSSSALAAGSNRTHVLTTQRSCRWLSLGLSEFPNAQEYDECDKSLAGTDDFYIEIKLNNGSHCCTLTRDCFPVRLQQTAGRA